MHILSTDLWQECQHYTKEKGPSLQEMVLGKLDFHLQKNKIGLLAYTIHKINKKCIKELNVRAETIKLLEENKKKSSLHWFSQ